MGAEWGWEEEGEEGSEPTVQVSRTERIEGVRRRCGVETFAYVRMRRRDSGGVVTASAGGGGGWEDGPCEEVAVVDDDDAGGGAGRAGGALGNRFRPMLDSQISVAIIRHRRSRRRRTLPKMDSDGSGWTHRSISVLYNPCIVNKVASACCC